MTARNLIDRVPGRARPLVWVGLGLVSLCAVGALSGVGTKSKLMLNYSPSLPHSAYWVDKTSTVPRRGQLAAFRYEGPQGSAVLLKRVVGVSGDKVEIIDSVYHVGAVVVGPAQAHTRTGQPLEALPPTEIGEGEWFVTGDHFESYDSRYASIGLVKTEAFIGTARPIF